jgi:hypothetical protein
MLALKYLFGPLWFSPVLFDPGLENDSCSQLGILREAPFPRPDFMGMFSSPARNFTGMFPSLALNFCHLPHGEIKEYKFFSINSV